MPTKADAQSVTVVSAAATAMEVQRSRAPRVSRPRETPADALRHLTLRGTPLADFAAEAARAEELGYAGVFSTESANDPFLPLALAAGATERRSGWARASRSPSRAARCRPRTPPGTSSA